MRKHTDSVRVGYYFVTNCISFTVVTLIYTVLGECNIFARLAPQHIFIFFGMTTAVMCLMMLTDRIPTSSNLLIIGMQILDVFIVECLTNLLFQWVGTEPLFHWTWKNILLIIGFNIVAYFGVFSINVFKFRKEQDQINNKLRQNRELSQKGEEYEQNH
jgi:hypothetical protein